MELMMTDIFKKIDPDGRRRLLEALDPAWMRQARALAPHLAHLMPKPPMFVGPPPHLLAKE